MLERSPRRPQWSIGFSDGDVAQAVHQALVENFIDRAPGEHICDIAWYSSYPVRMLAILGSRFAWFQAIS